MSKPIRLAKAAKEFNVGMHTIVEFLHKKGYGDVEEKPNYKLTPEMYDIVAGEYQSEKSLKDEAARIEIDYKKLQNSEEKKVTPEEDKTTEEFIIKNSFVAPSSEEVATPSEIETSKKQTPSPEPEERKVPEEVVPKEAALPEEKSKEPEPTKKEQQLKEEEVPVEEKVQEPIEKEPLEAVAEPSPETVAVISSQEEVSEETLEKEEAPEKEEEPLKEEEQSDRGSLKVVGKINLDDLNQRTRPPKKTKEQKQKEREDRKKVESERQRKRREEERISSQEKREKKEEKPEKQKLKEESLPPSEEKTPAESLAKTPPPAEDKKPDNFLETKVEKLSGPVILGSMELPVEKKPSKKKPVASSADSGQKRKKRKRISKPGDQSQQQKQQGRLQRDTNKGRAQKKKKDLQKQEVSDEEVQKQISETLKQLESRGKSRASKHRRDKRAKVQQTEQADIARKEAERNVLKVTEFVTVSELATMMEVPPTNVIGTCMSLGLFVSINQRLDAETLNLIAEEFGYKLEFVSVEVQEAIEEGMEEQEERGEAIPRHPIVTVMGHVDHGKTSLLDYIRHSNVIAGEAGGITQHIGAYEVTLEGNRKITFLDTPGHEAFTAMRARGAQVTDVTIIVIAADDKVMPQTIEAINHAQAAGVPIVFAINKIDKPGANPEVIKEGLANMNILVEEWGGKYQSQEISAKKGLHIDKLLEKVLLEAEMLELKGHPSALAKGTVLESSLDKGRGYIAKLLVQDGTLRVGDMVLAGSNAGRVRALHNERNQSIVEAGPSTPVLMLGLAGAPQAGDSFNVLTDESKAKKIASKRQQLQREQGIRTQKHITLDEIGRRIAVGNFKELNIIVKGDVDGSVEALADSLLKLSNDEVQVNIIHKSVGQIIDSDVLLATASDAIIIGFQVRPSLSARKLADNEQIDIRLYSVIYNAINELKDAIQGMLAPTLEEKITCNLEIRETFKISKVGTIAGCYVLDGTINRNTQVRIIRDGIVVYTGKLGSLKRFKDDVKEVKFGYECGLNIENFNDIKVGDIIEGYEEVEIKRKL
ncbi:MAG: translation initiation factor IF-2 [Bacteroidetes bacterium]|nr:MAG: translation initiation factor IF-2 [Bacteroidota bacterium]PIE87743.1 MAG: translation initiation factor IF-2 [Bacteroidota bacterium]